MNKNTQKIFTIVLISFSLFLFSCKNNLAEGDKAKAQLRYKDAADYYTKAQTDKGITPEQKKRAMENAAEAHRMDNNYEAAAKAYDKILKKDPKNTDALFYSGVMNMKLITSSNPDAEKNARESFRKYLEEIPNDPTVLAKIAGMDSMQSWKNQPSRFQVTNLKAANTKYNEFSPMVLGKKDEELYFTSDRDGGVTKKPYGWTGNFYTDVWSMKKKVAKGRASKDTKKEIAWENPVLTLGTINSKFNDGVTTFDRKFGTVYYTQCNGEDGKGKYCKIFEATKKGLEWGDIKMLEFCSDSFNYSHPALNEDGTKMYFTSDREGGEGGYDLWVSNYVKRGKTWGDPVNLGPVINTNKDEEFPYWNTHDQSLYFSSNGHIGLGSFDIFKSEGGGDEWSAPENLRAPLNSGGDDFGITFDLNNPVHGYFTSNRDIGKKINDDIYEFNITPLVIRLKGIVTDCNKKVPLKNSLITITNDKDTNKIVIFTNERGEYDTALKEKRNYEISCTNRELYYFDAQSKQQSTVGVKFSTTFIKDFCLESQIIEKPYPIYYDLNKAIIRPDAAKILDEEILPLLIKYPKLRVELGSHTDCRSSYEYNIDLSQRRADSAVNYLVKRGIDPRRIVAKGYGESQLVNDCACEGAVKSNCSEAVHQENRRTVIKTLDVNFDPSVKFIESTDPNNKNEKPIIVKLGKKDALYTVESAGNGVETTVPALIATGEDLLISFIELKALVKANKIKATDLTGITLADINAGRFKANATVKMMSLRVGPASAGKTMTEITLKVANDIKAPYQLGINALKKEGGTINTDEDELIFKNVNKDALQGGPVDSKILNNAGNPGTGNTGTSNTPGGAAAGNTGTTPKPADTVSLDGYTKIPLMSGGAEKSVATMINDKENVNWNVNLAGNKTEIDEETAKRLYENGVISKEDFEDGESIKINGTKLRSNTFIIKSLEISGVTVENVRVVINGKISDPVLGKSFWKKLNPIEKNGSIYVKPKAKKAGKSDD
ncbi:MAG: OmpA family protein [Bacteroidia bacterium]|nr:OmpA family protein [Bacteroidia bacterium]